jgi:hypothetical protein
MHTQYSHPTRLRDYIASVLPWAHGHQLKGVTDFVHAIIEEQTACQAQLARCFHHQEAAAKRLSRLLHHERLDPNTLADAVLAQALHQLPGHGKIRLAIDWTIEDRQVVYGYLTDNSRVGEPGKIASFHHPERGHRHGTELVILPTPRGRSGVALSDHPCLVA